MLRLLWRWLLGLCLSGVALLLLAAGIGQIMPEYTLAFASERHSNRNLYLLAVQHHLLFQLTHSADRLTSLAWSPDGQTLAYDALSNNNIDIFSLNIITSEQTILVEHPANDSGISWSPDGKFVVFASDRNSTFPDLYSLELATNVITRLNNYPGIDIYPQWSPNGKWIAYISSNRDDSSDPEAMSLRILDLATLKSQPQSTSLVIGTPAWSSDSSWIIFASMQAETVGYMADIFLLNLTTQTTLNLTHHPESDIYPDLSPDGHWLAFGSARSGNYELYLLKLLPDFQTGELQRLTVNDAFDGLPAWRP